MDKIKVLWMNNGEDDVYSVIPDAKEYGIEIDACKNFTECRRILSSQPNHNLKYDAVIINSFCRIVNEYPKTDNLEFALEWLKEKCSRIPWFVLNTREDMERKDKTKLTTTLKPWSAKLYSISQSKWMLFDDICEKVYSLPYHKYSKELYVCREQERDSLLNLLWKLHERGGEVGNDHTIPTDCRKVLEGIRNSVGLGVIHIPSINKPEKELNKFSKQIGDTEFGIPEYVKRSFHSCCNVSQEGSHSLETDKLIKQGKAPYLTKALIFELLNVLSWLYDINEKSIKK